MSYVRFRFDLAWLSYILLTESKLENKAIKMISFIRALLQKQCALPLKRMRIMPMVHFNVRTIRCQTSWVFGDGIPKFQSLTNIRIAKPKCAFPLPISITLSHCRALISCVSPLCIFRFVDASIWIRLTHCYLAIMILWILLLHFSCCVFSMCRK